MSSTAVEARSDGPRRRDGADPGYVAAQLAACQTTVGLALRRDLTILEVRASALTLSDWLHDISGRRVAVGTSCHARDGWLYRVSPDLARVVLSCRAGGMSGAGVDVSDVTTQYDVIALAGPSAAALAETTLASVAPSAVMLADESPTQRLIVVDRGEAEAAWAALVDGGRGMGALTVSAKAIDLHAAAQRVAGLTRR